MYKEKIKKYKIYYRICAWPKLKDQKPINAIHKPMITNIKNFTKNPI